ncbi:MAG: hypothetical protein ABEI27_02475 [Halobellus sp.]|uniref:hypothetical protein n=1 Tax=Halobellus sp. TaxID=1979212 RepID=UPI0035D4AFB5
MPSATAETTALLRSIRRLLLGIAFLLGIGLVVLADTGYLTAGYQDGLLFGVGGVAGGIVALASALAWLGSWRRNPETT